MGPRRPIALEKWYLDVLLADGTVVLVYLAALDLAWTRLARVTAEVFFPDGRSAKGDAKVDAIERGPDRMRFGPALIEGERLSFEAGPISGELRYRPRHPSWSPPAPFLRDGARTLTWTVEIPDADVTGTIRGPFGALSVEGRGYRDRVAFDLLPWRFPIRRLVWGRAVSPASAATWVHADTAAAPVAWAWRDGQAATGMPPPGVELGAPRTLVDVDVLSLEGLRLGPLRAVLARASKNPHETKWSAPCTIDGAPGVAIHEVVTW